MFKKVDIFKSVDISSLVFFRIVFGLCVFGEMMGLFVYYHLTKDTFDPEAFHFTYYLLHWVKPLNSPFIEIIFLIGIVASLCISFGKYYRFACFTSFLVCSPEGSTTKDAGTPTSVQKSLSASGNWLFDTIRYTATNPLSLTNN